MWPVTWVVGGSVKGQQVDVPLPHFFQPGEFLWQPLENFPALDMEYSFDRQIRFFRFGGCLRTAIGEYSKTGFNSGFLNSIAV